MWKKSQPLKLVTATLVLLQIATANNIHLSKHPLDAMADQTFPYLKALDINAQQRKSIVKIILPTSQNDKLPRHRFTNGRKIRQDASKLHQLPFAIMDTYMKAYHESHKKTNYNLEMREIMHKNNKFELDNKQFSELEAIHFASEPKSPINLKRETEILQITKDDSLNNINKQGNIKDAYRNKAERNSYAESFFGDQGVTIKPNGVIGIEAGRNHAVQNSEPKQNILYTSALPSNSYDYNDKTYSQPDPIHQTTAVNTQYTNVENNQLPIVTSLFHTSAQASQDVANAGSYEFASDLNDPLGYKLYTKAIPSTPKYNWQGESNHNDNLNYPQYLPVIDKFRHHNPSNQEHDFVEPKMPVKTKVNSMVTQSFDMSNDSIPAMVQNNYYKVEVASQTFSENPYLAEGYANLVPNTESTNEVYQNQGLVLNTNVKQLHQEETRLSPFSEDQLTYASSYEFGYRVRDPHSGNEFGHQETKDGEETEGHYHVLLPDGRLQNVNYWAGPAGYHAHISYDGGTSVSEGSEQ